MTFISMRENGVTTAYAITRFNRRHYDIARLSIMLGFKIFDDDSLYFCLNVIGSKQIRSQALMTTCAHIWPMTMNTLTLRGVAPPNIIFEIEASSAHQRYNGN